MKKPLTAAGVIAGIEKTNGNFAAVARQFGVTRQAVAGYVKKHPECARAAEEARERMLDTAESVLYKKVLDGSTPELLFFLKTQGRSRGYIEHVRTEVSGPNGGPVEVIDARAKLAAALARISERIDDEVAP